MGRGHSKKGTCCCSNQAFKHQRNQRRPQGKWFLTERILTPQLLIPREFWPTEFLTCKIKPNNFDPINFEPRSFSTVIFYADEPKNLFSGCSFHGWDKQWMYNFGPEKSKNNGRSRQSSYNRSCLMQNRLVNQVFRLSKIKLSWNFIAIETTT